MTSAAGMNEMPPMPDAPAPLPMCVDLAEEIYRASGRDVGTAKIIDSRVRPLVESLERVQQWSAKVG